MSDQPFALRWRWLRALAALLIALTSLLDRTARPCEAFQHSGRNAAFSFFKFSDYEEQ